MFFRNKKNFYIAVFSMIILCFILFTTKLNFKKPKNCILIIADAMRADHLGCYGYHREITPVLDKMAEEGILFENSVAQSSWTKPSYSAIITANHPTSIGITGMDDGLIDNITTAAEVFKEKGFYTAAFITNPYLKRDQGFAQGFDEYHALFPTDLSKYKIKANQANEEIFPWLEKNQDRKFFLLIFYLDPHTPYAPPSPYDTLFSPVSRVKENLWKEKIADPSNDYLRALINLYDGEIRFLDDQIGRLFQKLEELDLMEESLIVFNSDHGEEFYDHYWWQHNHTLYEELLRVPLIMRGPGLPENIRVKSPVQHIEIIPTVLDLMGLKQHDSFTGKPVTNLISDPENIINKVTYHETYLNNKKFIALRGIKWKLIFNIEKKTYQFYDLESDPEEKNNLLKENYIPLIKNEQIKKNYEMFKNQLHKLAEQAYLLRHNRRAFKKVKLDKEAIRLLEGLGYIRDF